MFLTFLFSRAFSLEPLEEKVHKNFIQDNTRGGGREPNWPDETLITHNICWWHAREAYFCAALYEYFSIHKG